MEIAEQIKLRFTGVDFPLVQLNSIKLYKETDIESNPTNVSIDPKVFLPNDSKSSFRIIMFVDIAAEGFFTLSVTAVGHFELTKDDVTDEVRKSFINANSTAIMFPYVRAFISTLTGNLGGVMNRILLPTRFFKGDLEIIQDEIITVLPSKKTTAKIKAAPKQISK